MSHITQAQGQVRNNDNYYSQHSQAVHHLHPQDYHQHQLQGRQPHRPQVQEMQQLQMILNRAASEGMSAEEVMQCLQWYQAYQRSTANTSRGGDNEERFHFHPGSF